MSTITFLIAPPCHGKTTYRNKHLKDVFAISRDDIREDYIAKNNLDYKDLFTPPGKNAKIDLITKMISDDYNTCLDLAKLKVKNDEDIVVDLANLMTVEERDDIWNILTENVSDVQKDFVIFECEESVVKDLNKKRGEETGKYIPFEIIMSIKSKFEEPDHFEFVSSVKTLDITKNIHSNNKKNKPF